jgi:hypothetical protein
MGKSLHGNAGEARSGPFGASETSEISRWLVGCFAAQHELTSQGGQGVPKTSKSTRTSSFTLTVPPATVTGVIPKSF